MKTPTLIVTYLSDDRNAVEIVKVFDLFPLIAQGCVDACLGREPIAAFSKERLGEI